jgi:hypothetical protein
MSRSLRRRLVGAQAVAALAGGSLTLAAGEAGASPARNAQWQTHLRVNDHGMCDAWR